MWFKNVTVFRLLDTFPYDAEQLAERLQEFKAKPCHKMAMFSYGWVSPFGDDSDVLVHGCNGCLLLAARREEKILPASVINNALGEKIKKIEANEDRTIYSKERKSLKDEVVFDLLPQAFTQKKITYAYIDTKANYIIIDSSSHNNAEELTKLLRNSINKFNIRPLETKSTPVDKMTDWLQNDTLSEYFSLDDNCELIDPKSLATIKCQKHDLLTKEIQQHLTQGKKVNKLGLSWEDKIAFVLNDDFSLKRLRYLDIIKEQLQELDAETKAEQIDIDFALMSGELSKMLKALVKACDGLARARKTEQDTDVEEELAAIA